LPFSFSSPSFLAPGCGDVQTTQLSALAITTGWTIGVVTGVFPRAEDLHMQMRSDQSREPATHLFRSRSLPPIIFHQPTRFEGGKERCVGPACPASSRYRLFFIVPFPIPHPPLHVVQKGPGGDRPPRHRDDCGRVRYLRGGCMYRDVNPSLELRFDNLNINYAKKQHSQQINTLTKHIYLFSCSCQSIHGSSGPTPTRTLKLYLPRTFILTFNRRVGIGILASVVVIRVPPPPMHKSVPDRSRY